MTIVFRLQTLYMSTKNCGRFAGAGVLVIYLATLYGTYVPDWEFVDTNGKVFTVSLLQKSVSDSEFNL